MERWAAASPVVSTTPLGFVSWAEVFVSNDKGRREVHYYLKRNDGSLDLALIGKEKSSRHMSYHYAFKNRSIFAASFAKLKSRREVIDWLNSLVSGAPASVDGKDGCGMDVVSLKPTQIHRVGHNSKEVLWLGSPWTCRKKRRHYKSFQRNGVKISVYDFVYVLAEEGKRLVAYLEDMYEDSRGNKMVVVRWFHKIDEVGLILPHNFNDREIFFSLCLQDLSIECIDGLATVLSPQHFEKFLKEMSHTLQDPFVCDKQFENDDITHFDITQVKGYWKQDILNYVTHTLSPSKSIGISQQYDVVMKLDNVDSCGRPKKRQCIEKRDAIDLTSVDVSILTKSEISNLKGGSCATASPNEAAKQDSSSPFMVGSQVEVFTQDSGIRGCWFRALIIKKNKDKLKVQYQDVQDAADDTKKLEEWILASRVAALDQLGLRMGGRTVVRPVPPSNSNQSSGIFNVGTVVDAWWHDGWWEGVVVQKESDDSFHVYLPEEKHNLIFSRGELRHSKEWFGNGWTLIMERSDVVTLVLNELEMQVSGKSSSGNQVQVTLHESKLLRKDDDACSSKTQPVSENFNQGNFKECSKVIDLSKDNLLAQLRWKSSKKRRRSCGASVQKLQCNDDGKTVASDAFAHPCERFLIPTALKIDIENCKYAGDSLFNSSVVPTLTNLVMSR